MTRRYTGELSLRISPSLQKRLTIEVAEHRRSLNRLTIDKLTGGLDSDLQRTVNDTAKTVAFRNRLIHACVSISEQVVWGVIESSLPKLHREVVVLLEERGASDDY